MVGGAVAAWPIIARAQQSPGKVWRVGYLFPGDNNGASATTFDAWKRRLQELGYLEGQNLTIDARFAENDYSRLPRLAEDMVATHPDAIVAIATTAVFAVQKATSTIPIVMAAIGDPVGSGFVKSLARPEGNLTGLTTIGEGVPGKRVQLLKNVFPDLSSVAMLFDPVVAYNVVLEVSESRLAAEKLGLSFEAFETRQPDDIDHAFSTIIQRQFGAVIVAQGPMFFNERRRMAELAVVNKLPFLGASDVFSEGGFLMSYGPSWPTIFRAAATYADKILKGAKPSDLPVQQPTIFELIINLKTAKLSHIDVSAAVLSLADRVIE